MNIQTKSVEKLPVYIFDTREEMGIVAAEKAAEIIKAVIAEKGEKVVGFAMGRFETYSDLTAYDLIEIIVAPEHQNCGIGTAMMTELENRVKSMGAAMIQLISVNDAMHERFYGKQGYGDASNLKLKSKFL